MNRRKLFQVVAVAPFAALLKRPKPSSMVVKTATRIANFNVDTLDGGDLTPHFRNESGQVYQLYKSDRAGSAFAYICDIDSPTTLHLVDLNS